MRRWWFVCCIAFMSVQGASSQEIEGLLQRFQSNLVAMGRYRVEFRVEIEDYRATGEYVVDGKEFYMSSDSVALYVADGVKHEVNMRKREVVIDSADNLGSDLISNPADAFEALSRDFEATTVEGKTSAVELRERGKSGGDTIRVEADASGRLPHRIIYRSAGSSLVIELSKVETYSQPLPRYAEGLYSGYEVIDFRE